MTNQDSDFFFGAAEPEREENDQPETQQPETEASASDDSAPTTDSDESPSTEEDSTEASQPESQDSPSADASNADIVRMSWEEALPVLQQRYPKASDGILFCVQKLLLDTELTLPDIRGEADLHGLKIGGRSVHSAKVLLGLAEKSVRRKKVVEPEITEEPTAAPETAEVPRRTRAKAAPTPNTATDTLVAAIQQIQDGAREEAEQLRAAMRDAIQILKDALGED